MQNFISELPLLDLCREVIVEMEVFSSSSSSRNKQLFNIFLQLKAIKNFIKYIYRLVLRTNLYDYVN